MAHSVGIGRRYRDSSGSPRSPGHVAVQVETDKTPWVTHASGQHRKWRTAVARLSRAVQVEWFNPVPIHLAEKGDFAVSLPGTLAAARVTSAGSPPVTVISMYGLWESLHRDLKSRQIYADAAVHRVISDISALAVGRHRIIAAGDLNVYYGYGERGSAYWAARYQTIFDRMNALGFDFVGPQAPNGRYPNPWPPEIPLESKNVPTFHTSHARPENAGHQLDFVFASRSISAKVFVKALNAVEEWGPSDHCRLEINVDLGSGLPKPTGGNDPLEL